jgi:hypothetical protein
MAASTIDFPVPAPRSPAAPSAKPLLYRVLLIDHVGAVYFIAAFTCPNDIEAEWEAHKMHVPFIGAGFELWQDDRLVFRWLR